MVAMADGLETVVRPKVASQISTLGIVTVGELLRYAPRRYVRQGQLSNQEMPVEDDWLTIVGRVTGASMIPMKKRSGKFLKVTVTDDDYTYVANFFNARFIQHRIKPGARVLMAGKVKIFRGQIQLSHPEWAVLPDGEAGVDGVVGSAMLAQMLGAEAESLDEYRFGDEIRMAGAELSWGDKAIGFTREGNPHSPLHIFHYSLYSKSLLL